MVVPRFAKLKFLLPVGAGLIVLAGLALAFAPGPQVANTIHPSTKPSASPSRSASTSASPSSSAAPSSSPTVAGASTQNTTQTTTKSGSGTSSGAANQTGPAPATPSQQVTLVLYNQLIGTSTFGIRFSSGMTACTILSEAKNEGKISSLSTTYGGAFVNEINGYVNHTLYGGAYYNWTFEHNGTYSNVGCSQVRLSPNDNVKWSFSDAHQN